MDKETAFKYFRARHYNPNSGRFISEDPIGFGGQDTNLYRYVNNNPIGDSDPSGLIKPRHKGISNGDIGASLADAFKQWVYDPANEYGEERNKQYNKDADKSTENSNINDFANYWNGVAEEYNNKKTNDAIENLKKYLDQKREDNICPPKKRY